MKHTNSEIQTVLRSLDPAAHAQPLATAERRARDRAAIVSEIKQEPRRHRPMPRRLVLSAAGVTAFGVVAAVVAGSLLLDSAAPGPAFAATPDPLIYAAPAAGGSAAAQLEQIAARTERLPAERYAGSQHIKLSSWYLWTQIDGRQVSSVVVPGWRDTWRTLDGAGWSTTGYDKPRLRSNDEAAAWDRLGRPGEGGQPETEPLRAGEGRTFGDPPAPTEPAALASYLTQGHPVENGPGETMVAITDLVREQVLGPAQRAALLRVLATVPGLTYAGETTDRAGRTGQAFSLRNSHGGLAKVDTLIVDPASGRLLDSEQLLLEAGKLNVRVPAVISYEVYLISEFADPPR